MEEGGGPLAALLRTRTFGRAARRFACCGSTNDEAAAWARAQGGEAAPEGAVVIAEEQISGRGRLGRRWHSPPGESLYLSLVLRPPVAPQQAPPLTLMAGVALAEAVEELGAAPELKWPNDLLLDGKKAAGILTEMSTSGRGIEHVIVGIGVNVATRELPEELRERATSLSRALRREVDREAFAASLLGHLEAWYARFLDGGAAPIVEAWKRRARLLERRVEVASGRDRVAGVAEDVDEGGVLIVRTDAGERVRVIAGEIL